MWKGLGRTRVFVTRSLAGCGVVAWSLWCWWRLLSWQRWSGTTWVRLMVPAASPTLGGRWWMGVQLPHLSQGPPSLYVRSDVSPIEWVSEHASNTTTTLIQYKENRRCRQYIHIYKFSFLFSITRSNILVVLCISSLAKCHIGFLCHDRTRLNPGQIKNIASPISMITTLFLPFYLSL